MLRRAREWLWWVRAYTRWRFCRTEYYAKEWLAVHGIKFKRRFCLGDLIKMGALASPNLYRVPVRTVAEFHQLIERCEYLEMKCERQAALIDEVREVVC